MKLYIYVHNDFIEQFLKGDLGLSLNISDMEPKEAQDIFNWTHLGEVDVELNTDEKTLRQTAMENIDKEIQKTRALSETRVRELETRKQNLLALDHDHDIAWFEKQPGVA